MPVGFPRIHCGRHGLRYAPQLPLHCVLCRTIHVVRRLGTLPALSPGYVREQVGRPSPGPPPGWRLAMNLRDWGPLAAPGRATVEEAWRDPNRMYRALESLVRRREAITTSPLSTGFVVADPKEPLERPARGGSRRRFGWRCCATCSIWASGRSYSIQNRVAERGPSPLAR